MMMWCSLVVNGVRVCRRSRDKAGGGYSTVITALPWHEQQVVDKSINHKLRY